MSQTPEEKAIFSDIRKAKRRVQDPDRFDEVLTYTFWMSVADVLARCLRKRIKEGANLESR